MDPVHRKIELQSLDDLKYLIDNVNQAAKERIVSAQKTSGARGQRQLKKKDIEELDAIVKTVGRSLLVATRDEASDEH